MEPGVDYIGVGVGALILNDEQEVLLTLRSRNSRNEQCRWELPGGRVEFNEKLTDAVKREVKEEINVDVEVIRLIKVRDHFPEGQHWVTPAYLCRIVNGIPKIMEPDKFDSMEWFKLDELPDNTSKITIEACEGM